MILCCSYLQINKCGIYTKIKRLYSLTFKLPNCCPFLNRFKPSYQGYARWPLPPTAAHTLIVPSVLQLIIWTPYAKRPVTVPVWPYNVWNHQGGWKLGSMSLLMQHEDDSIVPPSIVSWHYYSPQLKSNRPCSIWWILRFKDVAPSLLDIGTICCKIQPTPCPYSALYLTLHATPKQFTFTCTVMVGSCRTFPW